MPKLICILLISLPPFLNAQSSSIEEMEGHLYAVMDLFEASLKDLRAKHAVELNERELEISQLQAELKRQVNLNYELKTQLLSQDIVSANSLLGTREVAVNRGQLPIANQLSETPKQVPVEELVDFNSATLEEMLELPVMNELVAERIIAGRPWAELEDLFELAGVGQMRLSRWTPFVTLLPVSEDTLDTD